MHALDRLIAPFRSSLRRRAPLATSALVAVVLAAFLTVAFREVESTLLEAGGARAQAAADQLVNLLSGSAQQRLRDVRRASREPAVRAYLQHPSDDAALAARGALAALATAGQPPVELWDTNGRQLLTVRPTQAESDSRRVPPLPASPPAKAGVSAYQLFNGVVYWDAVAEVSVEERPNAKLLGYVSSRRMLSTSSDAIARLVGTGAVIKIGNQRGDVWSDLTKVVAAPPVDTSRAGVSEYRGDSDNRLGALAQITDTPWAVWVEFPRDVVVAPSRVFLARMLLFAVVFLAAAAFAMHRLTGRITKPLRELSDAAEAIAAGDVQRRVTVTRADEIGRLGATFNAMAEQVQSVQRDLEARVEQRTARLAQAEERTRDILRTANDAFFGMDPTGRIVDWNKQAEVVFGWSAKEAIGRTLAETIVPDGDREAHDHRLQRYARVEGHGLSEQLELVCRRRNGEEFPADATIWASGTPEDRTFHAFVRDITERKRAENAVREARMEADRANRAKSEFLSLMSHDLRTPLNAVLGFAQLLELENLNEQQLEHVQQILSGGRHLLELISEVLDITRVESGQLTISAEPVLVRDVVQAAVELVRPLAAQRQISIIVEPIGAVDAVHADRQRLSQILLNLLSNAVKYNRLNGHVTVRGERLSADRYRIAVTDTGAGIPESKIPLLFQPFERLGAEQTSIEGTGLGLTLSRSLATAMGGALGVNSVVDCGSTFWLELATAQCPSHTALPETSARASMDAESRSAVVLYIEDNQSNLRLMERILQQRPGVELLHAPDGASAFALLRTRRPELVLLDMHLPDMSGEEVLRHLWADPATRDIPVIVVTADATPGLARRLKAAGATACMTKPLDVNEVFRLLDSLLHQDDGVSAGELLKLPTSLA